MNAEAFNLLLDKLDLKLAPPYTLVGPTDKANAVAVSGETDDAGGVTSGNLAKRPYSPWELASFVLKVVTPLPVPSPLPTNPRIYPVFALLLAYFHTTIYHYSHALQTNRWCGTLFRAWARQQWSPRSPRCSGTNSHSGMTAVVVVVVVVVV